MFPGGTGILVWCVYFASYLRTDKTASRKEVGKEDSNLLVGTNLGRE
jgi:hypothetical protein